MELTKTTEEIMEYIWAHENGVAFRELYDYFTLEKHKTWQRQTLYTHITILVDKGFLKAEGPRRRIIYSPAISLDDYRKQCATKIVNKTYDGSLTKFVAAFTGQNQISKSDAAELMELISTFQED